MNTHPLIAQIAQKVIITSSNSVLLVLDTHGFWEIPGGRLDDDEQPIEGLKREIKEELSVEIKITGIFTTYVFQNKDEDRVFLVAYEAKLIDDAQKIQIDKNEVLDIKWVGKDDFEDLPMFSEHKRTLREYFTK